MRLIDADAFKKVLSAHEMQHDKRRSFDDYSCGAASAYEHAGDLLDEAPTIDRQHGKWVKTDDDLKISDYRCSVCGQLTDLDEPWNFCPNCGSDNRKGVKRNEARRSNRDCASDQVY